MESVIGEVLSLGLEPTTTTYSAVMDGYCKVGRPEDARCLLDIMKAGPEGIRPNATSYNTLVKGYAKCRCKVSV